jgi:hypothetical protein
MKKTNTMTANDVPCWMLDADYNGRVFMATQVFFPRTSARDSLEKDAHCVPAPAAQSGNASGI